ncbi:MAG: ArsB/NhaD family transporter [Nocardioides sp.]|uniref:SLC13 family permease n=1 Tax=Nocardioides sp. TaxID=35761 RepID=UPI0039E6522C
MSAPVLTALRDVVPVAALVVLIATGLRPAPARVEASVAALAIAATLALGVPGQAELVEVVHRLAPVLAFLAGILIVAEVCSLGGLFDHAAAVVARAGLGRPDVLLAGAFLLAAAVTVTLSLDATVVLLAPVAIGAARALDESPWPPAYACLRMANSASILLPTANLTNLLAMPFLHISFVGFAVAMLPAWLVVLAVEYVGLRWLLGEERGTAGEIKPVAPRDPVPWFPVVVVGLMLLGFAAGHELGLEPWVAADLSAALLAGWAIHRRKMSLARVWPAAHPAFLLYVLALAVVVAALTVGFLGDWVRGALPTDADLVGLLTVALLATVLANLLTNISAALLLLPLLAPLGTPMVLAALLGLNIGSGLTWTGSLANLLWRRGLTAQGLTPRQRTFHALSWGLTPVALLASVVCLWATY